MPPMAYFYSVNYDWATLGIYNGAYTLKLRLQVTGGSWEEYTRSVTVNNLSFGNANTEIIKWLDDTTQTSTSISVPIYGKALDNVNITATLNIYDCASATDSQTGTPVLVRSIQQTIANPDTVTFTWDGKDNSGNAVHRGLYSFDIVASRMQAGSPPGDTIKYRSETLSVLRGVDNSGQQQYDVEFAGYDNKTTTDNTDDDIIYYIRCYGLKDGTSISASNASKIELYNPDLNKVYELPLSSLKCITHNQTYDGCNTSATGTYHQVVVPIPCSIMDDTGTWRFLVTAEDQHANTCRWHSNKYAISINAICPNLPIVWLDTELGPDWQAAWCRAEYAHRITKEWVNCNKASVQNQKSKIASVYANPSWQIVQATINGNFFDNFGKSLTLPSESTYAIKSKSKSWIKTDPPYIVPLNTSKNHDSDVFMFNKVGSTFSRQPIPRGRLLTKRRVPYGWNLNYEQIILPLWPIVIDGERVKGDNNDSAYRSILVVSFSHEEIKRTGADVLLLTSKVGKTVKEMKDFVSSELAVRMNEYLKPDKVERVFKVRYAYNLDGGGSQQSWYSFGSERAYNGSGCAFNPIAESSRPIPDYFYVKADSKP